MTGACVPIRLGFVNSGDGAGAGVVEPAADVVTSDWVRWLDRCLDANPVDADAEPLVVQHRVDEGDGSEFCWYVRIGDGRARACEGVAPPCESMVTFSCDRATAVAIADAKESPQRAFLEGRLRLSGDVRLLIAARPVLRTLRLAGDDDSTD